MAELRGCAQCGTLFTPGREHARFCSAGCRMTWNREHAGVAATPDIAIDWSVTAMGEAVTRLSAATAWDQSRAAAAVGETVWWITLVDATLVRYHPRSYEHALAAKTVRRRKTEQSLAGLRYVRNALGRSADPGLFLQPGPESRPGAWTWSSLPEPDLAALTPRGRHWELGRYLAYRERLVGRDIARTFRRCSDFLTQAADLAVGDASGEPAARTMGR